MVSFPLNAINRTLSTLIYMCTGMFYLFVLFFILSLGIKNNTKLYNLFRKMLCISIVLKYCENIYVCITARNMFIYFNEILFILFLRNLYINNINIKYLQATNCLMKKHVMYIYYSIIANRHVI